MPHVLSAPNPRFASRSALFLVSVAMLWWMTAASAHALSFRADFRNSTYSTSSSSTFLGLLAQHESETLIESTTTTGLEDISTAVYASGVTRDYSMLLTTSFRVGTSGEYEFQVGTDWGRGGAAALLDENGNVLSERVIDDNVWWARNWNHGDVFTTTANLMAGSAYTLAWVGFEDCCGGTSTVRFSYEGSAFQNLNDANFAPYVAVPEPAGLALVAAGLAVIRRRRLTA